MGSLARAACKHTQSVRHASWLPSIDAGRKESRKESRNAHSFWWLTGPINPDGGNKKENDIYCEPAGQDFVRQGVKLIIVGSNIY